MTTRRAPLGRFAIPAVVVAALTACTGGGGSTSSTSLAAVTLPATETSTATTAPSTVAPTTAATIPPTTARPTTTLPPAEAYPVGGQFEADPVEWPARLTDYVDGVFYGYAHEGPDDETPNDAVLYRTVDGTNVERIVVDTGATYERGQIPGRPIDLIPRGLADSDLGYVIAGEASSFQPNGADYIQRPLMWFSADGNQWERIDLRGQLPQPQAGFADVIATDDGFLAVGYMGPNDRRSGPPDGVVVTSPDGKAWTVLATLDLPYAVAPDTIIEVGDALVIVGEEVVCNDTGDYFLPFGFQTRLWSSTDGGTTWTLVDLAATGIADDQPPPAVGDSCDTNESEVGAIWSLPVVGVVDDHLVLRAAEGSQVSVTSDLTTWAPAELPEGTAVPDIGSEAYNGGQHVSAGGEYWYLTSIEGLLVEDDEKVDDTVQPITWRSDDDGATWERMDPARPLVADLVTTAYVASDEFAFFSFSNGAGGYVARPSVAGEFLEWGTCEPVAGANCSFATLEENQVLDGLDLTGIDFTGAVLNQASFAGTNLTDAVFVSPQGGLASLAGANLTRARLEGMYLARLDLTDATLTEVSFANSYISDQQLLDGFAQGLKFDEVIVTIDEASTTLAGADLSGLVFTRGSFTGGFDTLVDANGVRFGGADLTGTTLQGLDLSGADFADTNLNRAYFTNVNLSGATFAGADFGPDPVFVTSAGGDVVCPDGLPAGVDHALEHACRL